MRDIAKNRQNFNLKKRNFFVIDPIRLKFKLDFRFLYRGNMDNVVDIKQKKHLKQFKMIYYGFSAKKWKNSIFANVLSEHPYL